MKKFSVCLLLMLAMVCAVFPAFAAAETPGIETGVAGEIQQPPASETPSIGNGNTVYQEEFNNPMDYPNVTVDDLEGIITEKGMDVVHILKVVGRYVCIAAFVVCCILIVIGVIGNRRMLTGAILGAVLAGVCYAAITCGDQIVAMIASWVTS